MNETCAFCNRQVPTEQAQDEFWEPSFWAGTVEISQAVCPDCRHNLTYNQGDYEMPLTQPVYVVGFYKDKKADTFYFLSTPDQEIVDYLAHHRPGSHIVHSIMNP